MIFDLGTVKQRRKQLNLTQHSLAKDANLSQSLLAKIEAGSVDPSYSSVKKLEEAFARLSAAGEPQARSFMTKGVVSVSQSTYISEVIGVLRKQGISQVPVIEKGIVIGLVSESSILDAKEAKTAKDALGAPPPIVQESTTRSVLAALLKQYPLILIAKNEVPVGVVTKADLLKTVS